ncbi:hypothetical protein [Actinoplanes solisilvae]|uniref:hypothetical protein n=1 Tax=Actinoplanes solisilvae TaxID=2486853 RepID=UPI000FD6F81E|nr:hypothetical protein [Actinoplanes solisilvae]
MEPGWDPGVQLDAHVGAPVDRAPINARHRELIDKEIALPGVLSWLDEARELGLRVAIASSSGRR